jgi:hypothetical protein
MVSDKELADMEIFLRTAKKPKEIDLTAGTRIVDVPKFIQSHLAVLQTVGNKPVYDGFWIRLVQLREVLDK